MLQTVGELIKHYQLAQVVLNIRVSVNFLPFFRLAQLAKILAAFLDPRLVVCEER